MTLSDGRSAGEYVEVKLLVGLVLAPGITLKATTGSFAALRMTMQCKSGFLRIRREAVNAAE
ncbi:MAG TPA: hypothetical protein VN678_00240 [Acidobacteriaceae bacterium]|nr:hypothetical protein [Acidobacteriaceae bacterium]